PLFRSALRQAVSGAAPDRQVKETASLGEARAELGAAAANGVAAGLLCLDLHMEDSDGFAGLVGVRSEYPALPVAVISGSEGADTAAKAIRFGASAFIPKSSDIGVIREAIEAVLMGDVWTPPGLDLTAGESDDAEEAAERLASLTPTQLRVLTLVREGLLNKQIAYELDISEATVKAHLTAIFRKLGVQTRTQAVMAAGVLEVERPAPREEG
ncbi:MAG: response regulator transcription factor, partial [Pseudomonadota bacterium]